MDTNNGFICVIVLLLGMLIANMLKDVCGCKNVVEGGVGYDNCTKKCIDNCKSENIATDNVDVCAQWAEASNCNNNGFDVKTKTADSPCVWHTDDDHNKEGCFPKCGLHRNRNKCCQIPKGSEVIQTSQDANKMPCPPSSLSTICKWSEMTSQVGGGGQAVGSTPGSCVIDLDKAEKFLEDHKG
jgi:hypothetical protein